MADQRNKPLNENPEGKDRTEEQIRQKGMDKTLADSFPASDPPSTIPDPETEDPAEDDPSLAA